MIANNTASGEVFLALLHIESALKHLREGNDSVSPELLKKIELGARSLRHETLANLMKTVPTKDIPELIGARYNT